ncbi:MAG: MMPL family transporter, partial [Anaerolineae bacterium]|nr:MMPL family transporter [Anaerolineae bacterium]
MILRYLRNIVVSTDIRKSARFKSVPVLICGNPIVIIGFVFSLFLLAVFHIYNPYTNELHINVDPSERSLLGQDHEGWEFYQLSRKTFGNDETIMVAIDSGDVFSPESIDLISRLTAKLSKVPGAQSVVSLTNALTIRSTEYGIDITPMMEKAPETDEDYVALRQEVMANPLIASALISKDNDTTAILVNLENNEDMDFLKQVKAAIDVIVTEEAHGVRISVTGSPLIKLATTETVLEDLIT